MAEGYFDIVPASYARRGGVLSSALGKMLMRLSGWRFEGALPDVPKIVIAVAPHTTNWDFVIGVMVLWALDIKISFLAFFRISACEFNKSVRLTQKHENSSR